MSYLIIFLIVVMVMGPVLWVMPSANQKRQMQLRQHALSRGFQIKLCDLPQSHRAKVRKESPERGLEYRLLWRHKMSMAADESLLLLRVEEGAEPLGDAFIEAMRQQLSLMPADVSALGCNRSGLACYWRERGTNDDIDAMHEHMQVLLGRLATIAPTSHY